MDAFNEQSANTVVETLTSVFPFTGLIGAGLYIA